MQPKFLTFFALVLAMLVAFQPLLSTSLASPSWFMYGRVVDATSQRPIANATILIWDLNTFEKPRLGAGIYLTNENGEYNVSAPYLKIGHTYRVYVYKGNLTAKSAEYVPVVEKVGVFDSTRELSFSLVPAAVIELEGTPYLVQSSSPGAGRIFIQVLRTTGPESAYVNEYGDSNDAWFLGLKRNIVIVPANEEVILEASLWFFLREQSRIGKDVFRIYNGSSPFLLPQGSIATSQIAKHSLSRGLSFVEGKFADVSSEIGVAQRLGFVVFDERRLLTSAHEKMIEASIMLASAQVEGDFLKIWSTLRDASATGDLVSLSLDNMRLVSKTSAIYLSAIMAAFSAVLALFFFEQKSRKIVSNMVIYIVFLTGLYYLYPGAHIIIDENYLLFLESVGVSFLAVSAIVFGLPQIWKERSLEGEVSVRSAISVIFSMGKREIRRKKVRGFFTILSIIILVLAFTSMTSFGTIFGIVSEKLDATAPSDGVMVKRIPSENRLLFSPLGSDDPTTLSKMIRINSITLRLKNIPSLDPLMSLTNTKTGNRWFLYGVVGITPENELLYTRLNEAIVDGAYLSELRDDEILISRSVASNLSVPKAGTNVTLEAIGAGVSSNFIVKGIIDDARYGSLIDMDGRPFGPVRVLPDGSLRVCNSSEVVIMSWKAVERLQEEADSRYRARGNVSAPSIALLSEIIFQPEGGMSSEIARTLIFVFDYDVFAASRGMITYYHVGSYFQFKGAAELLIPLVMVGLNVGMVMLNSVYERRREIRTLSMLGLNPTHIGLIFVAEAIILGMVGGSLGYLFGLGFYRVMVFFGQDLMVREKLEWWWSAIGFGIALAASVLSAVRPAALAVSTYTPSKIKRMKIPTEEEAIRKERIFKAYQARELTMPVKIMLNEKEFFLGLVLDRLSELKTGHVERIESIEDMPEIENVRGVLIKTIRFNYRFVYMNEVRKTRNSLILARDPKEDYYRVKLVSEPAVLGMPESAIDRTIDFIHDIALYWAKHKERLIGA